MPFYKYKCETCGETHEALRKIDERDSNFACPSCGSSETKRLISGAPGFTTSESLGLKKAPREFREFLDGIHKRTPGSNINSRL